ncbi:MAG: hypothetical protein HY370_00555 [Proteobacteria bacterium]|nr:hypothetical protein [Pseudomonadota bacterium]
MKIMKKKAPFLVVALMGLTATGVFAQEAMPTFEAFNPVFSQVANLAESDGLIIGEGRVGKQLPDGGYEFIMGTSSAKFSVSYLQESLVNTMKDLPADMKNRDAVMEDMKKGVKILDTLIAQGKKIITLNSDTPVFRQLFGMIENPKTDPSPAP